MFLRDTSVPFLLTFLQIVLANALPQFAVSSSGHENYTLKGYMKETVGSVRFLCTRFSLEYISTVSRKCLSKDLKDVLFPVPLYRTIFCNGPGQDEGPRTCAARM